MGKTINLPLGYESPFSTRYGSDEMRHIWGEHHKRLLWRMMWGKLAASQCVAGQVTEEELANIGHHLHEVDMAASLKMEAETHHDLVAELRVFAAQCEIGGRVLHLGATSSDIVDNADVVRIGESADLLSARLLYLLEVLAEKVEEHADVVCIGWTHLQAAEPTTVGYRLASYLQDLLGVCRELDNFQIKPKGFRGAVGTGASFDEGVRNRSIGGAKPHTIVTQVYPRIQDYRLTSVLAQLAAVLYRFAFDLRLLQSNGIGEWLEPFGKNQVGSSAMPFKRNPIDAENICSLARLVATLPRVAWDNAANSFLERTLDDSANRRVILPQAFLACDEMVMRATKIVEGLEIDEQVISRNLHRYGAFAATETLLLALVEEGADRLEMHEIIKRHCMVAAHRLRCGDSSGLVVYLASDSRIRQYLDANRIYSLFSESIEGWVGDAPDRAQEMTSEALKYVRERG